MNASYSDLKGKVVLVTGSSKALGAEAARAFARSGCKIVVNGRDKQAIGRIVGEIQAVGGESLGITADVTSTTDLTRLRTSIYERFGTLDVLAAFAGGTGHDCENRRSRNSPSTELWFGMSAF